MDGGSGPASLPRLEAGAAAPTATARLTGRLVQAGNCAAAGGGGTTIIIWALAVDAESSPGGGTVIVIWPRSATVRRDGGGTTVIVWPFASRTGTPVRLGERVVLDGEMKDDVSGLRLERPLPAGCTGRAFVVREFRPAPAS